MTETTRTGGARPPRESRGTYNNQIGIYDALAYMPLDSQPNGYRKETQMRRANSLLNRGDKVFIVERRLFDQDLKRHFVGEVEVCTEIGFRARGYPFFYHPSAQKYVRKAKPRTRLFPFDGNLIINVLPREVDVESVNYLMTEIGTTLTDRKSFELDVSDPDQKAPPAKPGP